MLVARHDDDYIIIDFNRKQWLKYHIIQPNPLLPTWYYLPTPPFEQDMTQGQLLSGV